MIVLLWTPVRSTKRYAPEVAATLVDALVCRNPYRQWFTAICYAEVYSILLRKFNGAHYRRAAFAVAKSALGPTLLTMADFVVLSVDDTAFYQRDSADRQANILNRRGTAYHFQSYINLCAGRGIKFPARRVR